MTKITITRLKKDWTPPFPISSVMVLFMHYLTYKILAIYSIIPIQNIYDYADFWGIRPLSKDSPLTLLFYIYSLLMGYSLVELRSDWPLFPRFRNIVVYGITLLLTAQSIIGLDLIRRFSPYNPDQINKTNILEDAILKNDMEEVKRLIAIGYEPFEFSIGNRNLFDDYKWIIPAYWPTDEEWDRWIKRQYYIGDPSIFYFASVSGIKNINRNKAFLLRKDFEHPYKPDNFPAFDDRIFNYLLSLGPSKKQRQDALREIAYQGNTAALNKLLAYDPSLTPTMRNIETTVMLCYTDVSKILLKRYFDNAPDKAVALDNLYEELGFYVGEFTPCTAPIRKYLNSGKHAYPKKRPPILLPKKPAWLDLSRSLK